MSVTNFNAKMRLLLQVVKNQVCISMLSIDVSPKDRARNGDEFPSFRNNSRVDSHIVV